MDKNTYIGRIWVISSTYLLVNIFKKIRKRTQITKNATSHSIFGWIYQFFV